MASNPPDSKAAPRPASTRQPEHASDAGTHQKQHTVTQRTAVDAPADVDGTMNRLLRELRVRARLRLNTARRDAAAHAAPVPDERLRDCLRDVAREFGFTDWEHARHVLAGRAAAGEDQGSFWYATGCSAVASPWFAHIEQARAAQQQGATGVLLPYHRQFLLASDGFLLELGLNPDSPLWDQAGRDLVRSAGSAAWEALVWARLVAMRPLPARPAVDDRTAARPTPCA